MSKIRGCAAKDHPSGITRVPGLGSVASFLGRPRLVPSRPLEVTHFWLGCRVCDPNGLRRTFDPHHSHPATQHPRTGRVQREANSERRDAASGRCGNASVESLTVVDGMINELAAIPAAVAAAWAEQASPMCRWTALDNQRSITRMPSATACCTADQPVHPIFWCIDDRLHRHRCTSSQRLARDCEWAVGSSDLRSSGAPSLGGEGGPIVIEVGMLVRLSGHRISGALQRTSDPGSQFHAVAR
jgi:hypothetical protein